MYPGETTEHEKTNWYPIQLENLTRKFSDSRLGFPQVRILLPLLKDHLNWENIS